MPPRRVPIPYKAPYKSPPVEIGPGSKKVLKDALLDDREAVDRVIKKYREGRQPVIPTDVVRTIVKAVDLVLPEVLEERSLAIATLYLNGVRPADIAKELNIHPGAVSAELARIDYVRSQHLRASPEYAQAVVEKHFDVLACSEALITNGLDVLRVIHESILQEKEDIENWRPPEEKITCSDCGKVLKTPKRERRPGLRPMVLQAYWQGLDAIGKHQDRIGEILGIMRGKGDKDFNQFVNNVQVTNINLDALADAYMKAVGQVPITVKATPSSEERHSHG